MRIRIALSAIMVALLLGSTPMVVAQTGEFAGQVPSQVIRDAWELQGQLQDARSGKRVSHPAQSYGDWNAVKPASATINGTKGER